MTLEAWIEEERARFEVPGLAVAVVHDGKVVLSDTFGRRDVDRDLPVTPDTAFAIGSVTKAFTAATVAALVDDGLLAWDTPVREYIPGFRMHDPVATDQLTPRDLLCHRSGLPRHDLVWYGEGTLSRDDIVARLRHLEPNKSFRSTWQYNNLMYLTAGYLCEVVTSRTWEDVLRERVLEAVGMSSTTFGPDQCAEVALPYGERQSELQQIPYARDMDVCGPAGSIYSTIADMTAWVQVNLDGGRLGDRQVLSDAVVRELHAPQMVTTNTPFFPEASNTAYGLGWSLGTYRGHRVVHHGGNIDGFTALVSLLPDEGIGVLALANRHITMLCNATAWHVFDDLLELDPLPWGERWKEAEHALLGGMRESKARAPRIEGTAPSHASDEYAGAYEHPAYGRLTIEHTDGSLVPSFHGLGAELRHRHYDVFELEIAEFEETEIPVIFRTDASGDIAEATVAFEPSVAPIIFTRVPEIPAPDVVAGLAGTYSMGPISVVVEVEPGGRLTASTPAAPRRVLLPHKALTFRVEDAAGVTLTFVLDDAGRPTEVIAHPGGVFRRDDLA